jgi:hypothetical protein
MNLVSVDILNINGSDITNNASGEFAVNATANAIITSSADLRLTGTTDWLAQSSDTLTMESVGLMTLSGLSNIELTSTGNNIVLNASDVVVNARLDLNNNDIINVDTLNVRNLYAFGRFISTISQNPSTANTPEQIIIDADATPSGAVDLVLGTNRVVISKAGYYQIILNGLLHHASGSASIMDIWLQRNGVDIPNSTQHTRLTNSVEYLPVSGTFIEYLDVSDEITAFFASDSTNTGFQYSPAITSPWAAPERPGFSLSFLLIG